MKVGIISDTHISAPNRGVPPALMDHLRGSELILHAGDLVVLDVIESLREVAPVEAVAGNMDDAEVKKTLPSKKIIPVEKILIGLIHGWGAPWGLPERVLDQFPEDVAVVVFGHSHRPEQLRMGQTLLFNPGSALKTSFSRHRSYGILTVEGDRVRGEIFQW